MDQKTWLWRKKASEKIILSTDKINLSVEDNKDEIQTLVEDRRALENELKILNNKLSSALSESSSKDELVKKHEKVAMEAVVGKGKVEVEAVLLKQERNEALQMTVACEERLTRLDAALKECMQQLRFVQEEQERRIHDAVTKALNEFEKSQTILEAQLAESSKRVTKLVAEHANLMLKKELEIRNEEREFNRQTAEASHKQQLGSVKKIAKLESECQRLRLLVRKRLPGPAALAKMKNEVEMLGKDSIEMSKRKLDTSPGPDFIIDSYSDSPRKRINILNEQLWAMEEENKTLKEALNKKTSELQLSKVMYGRTASKLSEVETQIEESSKSETNNEATRNNAMPHEVSLASMSDVGSDPKASSAESWASALISELEQFRKRQLRESLLRKTVGSSEINLMDDFVEMEKLALVSVDQPSVNSHISSTEANRTLGPLQTGSSVNKCKFIGGPSSISGYISWKPSNGSLQMNLSNRDAVVNICSEDKSNQQFHPDLSKSICRIIELIEGIIISSADNNIPEFLFKEKNSSHKHSETPWGYTVHVYQWKTSEFGAVLQQFLRACHELLNEKTGLKIFIQELTSSLDWIISETEAEVGIVSQFPEEDKLHFTVLNGNNDFFQKEHNVKEENKKQRDELTNMEAETKHLEDKLQSTTNRSDSLSNQLEESEKSIANMQAELDTLRGMDEMVESRVQKLQFINKNLNNQLSFTKVIQNEACEKFHSQDLDSEGGNYRHEELEVTCLDSVTEKEIPNSEIKKLENQFRTLKALASPKEAVPFDKVVPAPTETITPTSTAISTSSRKTLTSQRSSLLDQMIAEDNDKPNDLVSPKTKEKIDPDSLFLYNRTIPYLDSIVVSNGDKHQDDNAEVKSLPIVPSKKQGGSLWKKLVEKNKK
ncbi:Filament-like plant protein 7, putative isoform 2 [Hibiscus syriacus]|uniref:Filament-like plant protein 7, putative isoform 2 n=1 Tax=Hibiscus syriacus TaxID=106335 RepID=A0A6A3C0B5_HIBSY|nr:Filament-like plant protein 7, putative isoform 2 [Hibiscus syriacus]